MIEMLIIFTCGYICGWCSRHAPRRIAHENVGLALNMMAEECLERLKFAPDCAISTQADLPVGDGVVIEVRVTACHEDVLATMKEVER